MSHQNTDSGSRLLKPRFVACALLLLFLVILSITVLVINRQCSDLKKQALASDSTVTSLLSEFVLEHEKAAIALLQSYAARPLLIDAVKRKDVAKTRSHLEGMKAINEELDLTYITDKRGILWANYPVFPEAVGKDLSYRDWYKGVSSGWKPYISTVFKLIVADQPFAVAVCVPIFDREGNVIGILANSQRVAFLAETIRRVPLQSYTKVTLLDRAGNIIYSNRLRYTAEITTYPFLSAVKEALQAGKSRIEIEESQRGVSTVSATVRPIASIEWTVVAEHRSKDVLRAGYAQFVTTAAMSLLFFTAVSLLLLYARKQALLADTERLLMMERKISEEERQRQMQDKLKYSEMKYLRLHESMIDGFAVIGMDGYIRECNQAFQHILGYGPDEIMSLTYNDITPVKWHDLEKTIVEEQVIPRGHSEVYEKEYIRRDGTVFPVELRTYLIKDDKGSPGDMWAIVRDITERKCTEEALLESEQRCRLKLESMLSPEGDVGNLDLADIIDAPAIQSLMDDFYGLTHIPMAIIDLKGRVLVGVGWQDICTKFHRVHPETCKHCIESDIELSDGVLPGEFRLYKCKNNMWDIATPIVVGDQHVGNVFSGQFFFEGEPLDHELFRSQARQYGFDEEEYLAALEAVPRLSKESVDRGMAFLTKLAHMLSQLSYSNIKLARSLTQRAALMDSLRESEELFRLAFDQSPVGATLATVPERRLVKVNEAFSRFTGYSREELTQMAVANVTHPDDLEITLKEVRRMLAGEISSFAVEKRYIRKDGTIIWGHLSVQAVKDNSGRILYTVGIVEDITERKQAEDALRQSEKRYRSLFDNMLDGFAHCRMLFENDKPQDFIYLDVNTAFEALTGLKDVPGKKVTEVIPGIKESNPGLFEIYGRVALTGKAERFDAYVEGLKAWLSVSVYGAEEGCFIAVFDNITERKLLEQTLRESEEKYRDLAELLPQTVFETDVAGRITFVNNHGLEHFGFSREDFHKGVCLPQVISQEDWPRALDNIRRVLEGEGPPSEEYTAMKKDGSRFPAIVSSTPIIKQGKPVGLRGIVTDISQLKQAANALKTSERRYRTLVESSSDAILLLNTNRDILSCNNAFPRLFGYEKSEVEGKSIRIIHPSDESFRLFGEMAYPAIQNKNTFRTEFEFSSKDGCLFPVESVTSAIRDQNERITGFVAIIRDITVRRQAEEQIKASLVEKEALLKEIHHRVKNNLQIISSLLHLEARRTGHPEVVKALMDSRSRVKSIALIHEKLYQSPSLARVDMADYAKSLTHYVLESYKNPGPRVCLKVAAEGVWLDAESAMPCGLIINELVSNALKHAFPEGRGGEIGVSLRQKNGHEIELMIRDDGIGLLDHLDFRNSPSLGLNLVCNLAKQLNGTIELDRKVGTTFTISFQPKRAPL